MFITTMNKLDQRSIRLGDHTQLGYGSAGAGTSIPPNAALVFTVDLLAVQ